MMLLNDHKTFLLNKRISQLKGIKWKLEVILEKLVGENIMIETSFTCTTKRKKIMNGNGIESALKNMRSDIEGLELIDLQHNWSLEPRSTRKQKLSLSTQKIYSTSYRDSNKEAMVNLKNEDDRCFIYCLGRALDPNPEKNHLDRVITHLKNVFETLRLNNIETLENVQDLPKIERQFNVWIDIYGHSKTDIYSIYSQLLQNISTH